MFFVQMSGFPGSGKSTLSREISKQVNCVIVDHDIVKSALLHSINESPIDPKLAGEISFNIDWSLIEFHLSLGLNVIFDSPCLYDEMIEKGTKLAEKYQAKYKYIECYLDNMEEINARLKRRERKISQIEAVQSEEAFLFTINNSKKPSAHPCFVVDTSRSLESYIEEVLAYLKE